MRTPRTPALLLAAGVLAGAGLAGCSADGGGSDVTVAFSANTLSNPFFAGMLKGLEEGASSHGFELVTTNANGDPAQQVTDLQNLVSRGVDYILINPTDAQAVTPGIEAARAADIPVIAIAEGVEPEITSTIGIDDEALGASAAEFIVAELEEKNGEARGSVVDIQGTAGIPTSARRDSGFRDHLAAYPDVEIVAAQDGGYDTEKANGLMVDILQANPDIDAVFATNDAMALGVTAALRSQGRYHPVGHPDHVVVVGADGSAPAITDIRDGVQDATISLNPVTMAEHAMDLVADLEDEKDVEQQVTWPTQLITTENIDGPEVGEYGIWADAL